MRKTWLWKKVEDKLVEYIEYTVAKDYTVATSVVYRGKYYKLDQIK